jgi:hypothetical protein
MSEDFLWELEKLRRRFGVGREEIQAAAVALTRKRRGPEPQKDDDHLVRIRAGISARKVAADIGGRGAGAAQIRISRKARKDSLQSQYWRKIEELTDILTLLSPKDKSTYMTRLAEMAGPSTAPHLILLDIADCGAGRVLDANRLSADDRDHLERARLHLTMIKDMDLDSPLRRKALRSRIQALEKILQELRATIT